MRLSYEHSHGHKSRELGTLGQVSSALGWDIPTATTTTKPTALANCDILSDRKIEIVILAPAPDQFHLGTGSQPLIYDPILCAPTDRLEALFVVVSFSSARPLIPLPPK